MSVMMQTWDPSGCSSWLLSISPPVLLLATTSVDEEDSKVRIDSEEQKESSDLDISLGLAVSYKDCSNGASRMCLVLI